MRPTITMAVLKTHVRAMYSVFHKVATSEDFKGVFAIQAFNGRQAFNQAVAAHCEAHPALIKRMEEFANKDENYKVIISDAIQNRSRFPNVIIPSRPCDFMTDSEQQQTYFWIDERIELNYHPKSHTLNVAKLLVDETADVLLYNAGDEEGWVEYGHSQIPYGLKVAEAYKNFLADKVILREDKDV